MPVMTRWEYRQEYLHSDHWKELRAKVMKPGTRCFKCKAAKATDPHHLRYRKIYDVLPEDLVPVCRACHDLIESAKRIGFLKSEHYAEDLDGVSEEAISRFLERTNEMSVLNKDFLEAVNHANRQKQLYICGIMKLPHPGDFTEWVGIITTRCRVKHAEWVLRKYQKPKLKGNRKGPRGRRGPTIHY